MVKTDPSLDNRLFRRSGFYFLLGVSMLGGIYTLIFASTHLENYLETYGSRLNLARVDIGSVSIDWLHFRVTFDGIEIAHGDQPMRNLMEIDRVTIEVSPTAVLKRKLIVTNLRAEGVHLMTTRSTSGLIDLTRENVGPGLLDRAAGVYAELRRDVERNPLRRLAQLSTGLDLDTKVSTQRGKLSVLREVQKARTHLDAVIQGWEKTATALPSSDWVAERRSKILEAVSPRGVASARVSTKEVVAELRENREALKQLRDLIRTEAAALSRQLIDLDRFAERDIAVLRQSLDLPQFDSSDLSLALFGPRALNQLERLAYWVDLSRRRMPVGARHGQIGVVQRQAGPGTSYHFGKASALPTFLIEKAEIVSSSSPATGDASLGEVSGTIEDLTTDPPIWRKPTRIHLVAEFPGRKIYGLRIDGVIDHTGEEPLESLDVRVASAPVKNWSLYEGADLSLDIQNATGVVKFESVFKGQTVDCRWKGAAIDITYGVKSTYSQIEDFVRDSLRGPNAFELAGQASGQIDKLSLRVTSDIGRQLGTALHFRFRHSLGAIDDALKNDLLDEYDSTRQNLLGRLRDAQTRAQFPLESRAAELQSLIDLAEKGSARSSRRASQK